MFLDERQQNFRINLHSWDLPFWVSDQMYIFIYACIQYSVTHNTIMLLTQPNLT